MLLRISRSRGRTPGRQGLLAVAWAAMLYGCIVPTSVKPASERTGDIRYGLTLYSAAGAQIAAWSVSGRGNEPIGNPLAPVGTIRRSFEQAMREAALKLTSGFREVPEVRRWLEEQGIR